MLIFKVLYCSGDIEWVFAPDLLNIYTDNKKVLFIQRWDQIQ